MNNPNYISQEEFERIERYVLGNLSAHEAVAFELEMEENELLRQKFEEVEAFVIGIEEGALRYSLNTFHKEMEILEANEQPNKKTNYWAWASAAVIAFFVATTIWMLCFKEDFHSRRFAQFYRADPGLITAMSSASSYDFDRAMVAYKSGNYQDAIRRWEKIYESNTDNDTLNYFLGSAHLAKQEVESAVVYFQKVEQLPQGRFTNDNYWYLALSYLKMGRIEDAVNTLYKTDHPMKDELLNAIHER